MAFSCGLIVAILFLGSLRCSSSSSWNKVGEAVWRKACRCTRRDDEGFGHGKFPLLSQLFNTSFITSPLSHPSLFVPNSQTDVNAPTRDDNWIKRRKRCVSDGESPRLASAVLYMTECFPDFERVRVWRRRVCLGGEKMDFASVCLSKHSSQTFTPLPVSGGVIQRHGRRRSRLVG